MADQLTPLDASFLEIEEQDDASDMHGSGHQDLVDQHELRPDAVARKARSQLPPVR
jgi:hypothetical protein